MSGTRIAQIENRREIPAAKYRAAAFSRVRFPVLRLVPNANPAIQLTVYANTPHERRPSIMLRSTAELAGLRIHATDGDIGSLANVYFDDIHWQVRYFVVDTGHWLPGRLVLMSPAAVESADLTTRKLNVRLAKKQVEGSPGIEAHEPVSRQHEQHVAKYYGWPVYWPAEGCSRQRPRT